jgi:NAD(P)-dependent dehydrogenase (short-subunit alcohol dehydrogenase family)
VKSGRFGGRVALVTGGSSGIGLATAQALIREGAQVMITGMSKERGEKAIFLLGERARYCQMDVRDSGGVASAFEMIDGCFGGLDILFNNAGVNAVGDVDQVSVEMWDTCFDTNVKGAFLASREAIPRFRRRGGGVIINNASNAGLVGRARDPVYSASKAALIMLTKAMAVAHARDRIRVNAVCPGPVSGTLIMEQNLASVPDPLAETSAILAAAPLAQALQRMVTPEEVAEAVLYLCSDAAAMVTGAVLSVDGGKSAGIPR